MNVLQELGGWESEEMVRRYAHLSKPQLMQHAELVSNVLDDTICHIKRKKRLDKPSNLLIYGESDWTRTNDQGIMCISVITKGNCRSNYRATLS